MGPGRPANECENEELVNEFELACRGGDYEFAPEYREELMKRLSEGRLIKLNKQTIIKKIFEGIDKNSWTLLNGLGSGNFSGESTQATMVEPLLMYLKKKGIEIG